jgi:hypothetical protein
MKRTSFKKKPRKCAAGNSTKGLKPLVPKSLGRRLDSKKPWRSKPYRDSVKEHPCLVCKGPAQEAHHIREQFPRTMGVRVGDQWCVPLCKRHHDELHAHSKTFWADAGIEPRLWCTWHQGDSPIFRKHKEPA